MLAGKARESDKSTPFCLCMGGGGGGVHASRGVSVDGFGGFENLAVSSHPQ